MVHWRLSDETISSLRDDFNNFLKLEHRLNTNQFI